MKIKYYNSKQIIIYLIVFFLIALLDYFIFIIEGDLERKLITYNAISAIISYIVFLFKPKYFMEEGLYKIEDDCLYLKLKNKEISYKLHEIFMIELNPRIILNIECWELIINHKGKKFILKSIPYSYEERFESDIYKLYRDLQLTNIFNIKNYKTLINIRGNLTYKNKIERERFVLKRK